MKHIFIIGGVVSSLGKGIIGASLGALLKSKGNNIFIQKLDPYLNIDSGTMNPNEHGEVFVLEDGMETDLDLGHYERFTSVELNKNSSITQGRIYLELLRREREGVYLGETVQVIPHVTNLIKEKILYSADENKVDIMITEVGGTVGDIESLPFIESIRNIKRNLKDDVLIIYTTLIPYLHTSGEFKSKPTQHSISVLRSLGIDPDLLILRSTKPIASSINEKISMITGIDDKYIFNVPDLENIYKVPIYIHNLNIIDNIEKFLNLKTKDNKSNIEEWKNIDKKITNIKLIDESQAINVVVIGKYTTLKDAYISVEEALKHASYNLGIKINIIYISTDDLQKTNIKSALAKADGILIPGGFGQRGTEEKIAAIEYARENNVPFFGICLGMQLAAIEYARNVIGLVDATSEEFSTKSENFIIKLLDNQVLTKGGTQRLGAYECHLVDNTKTKEAYQKDLITERHRHRYEFNVDYTEIFQNHGMVFSGINPQKKLVEIIELLNHPHFIASQFHPEFKSQLFKPHPLFLAFLKAATNYKNNDK